jgi:hypothetical protein
MATPGDGDRSPVATPAASSSSATLRISPMVPAKMAPSCSLREGCETAKKYL